MYSRHWYCSIRWQLAGAWLCWFGVQRYRAMYTRLEVHSCQEFAFAVLSPCPGHPLTNFDNSASQCVKLFWETRGCTQIALCSRRWTFLDWPLSITKPHKKQKECAMWADDEWRRGAQCQTWAISFPTFCPQECSAFVSSTAGNGKVQSVGQHWSELLMLCRRCAA